MKRLFRSSNQIILGMAMPRKAARDELYSLSKPLCLHVTKCIVYGKTLGDDVFAHWVHEICVYLFRVSSIFVKPNNRRLKKEDYRETLFCRFGDDINDANGALGDLLLDAIEQEKYPEFEPEKYAVTLYHAFRAFQSYTFDMLNRLKVLRPRELEPEVKAVLLRFIEEENS